MIYTFLDEKAEYFLNWIASFAGIAVLLIAPLWLFCRRRTFVNPGVLVGLTFSVFLLSFIAGQFLPGLRTFQKDLVTIPVSGANTQFSAMISAVRGGLKFSNSFSAEEILKNESYELRSLSKASAEDNWRLDKADDTQIEHILSGARCLADGAASFPLEKISAGESLQEQQKYESYINELVPAARCTYQADKEKGKETGQSASYKLYLQRLATKPGLARPFREAVARTKLLSRQELHQLTKLSDVRVIYTGFVPIYDSILVHFEPFERAVSGMRQSNRTPARYINIRAIVSDWYVRVYGTFPVDLADRAEEEVKAAWLRAASAIHERSREK